MEEGTRNTIIGAVGLGLALSYGLPKLFPLNEVSNKSKNATINFSENYAPGNGPPPINFLSNNAPSNNVISDNVINDGPPSIELGPHAKISELEPDFPQINLRIGNFPLGLSPAVEGFGAYSFYEHTIPYQLISNSGLPVNHSPKTSTGWGHEKPTHYEMSEIVNKTRRIVVLGGSMIEGAPGDPKKRQGDMTQWATDGLWSLRNHMLEADLLKSSRHGSNVPELAHAPFRFFGAGLETLIEAEKSIGFEKWDLLTNRRGAEKYLRKPLEYDPEKGLTIRLQPLRTKVNTDKWLGNWPDTGIRSFLRTGKMAYKSDSANPADSAAHNFDYGLIIMLTDDDLFRCYIPLYPKLFSYASAEPFLQRQFDEDGMGNEYIALETFENRQYFPSTLDREHPAWNHYMELFNNNPPEAIEHTYDAKTVFLMPYERYDNQGIERSTSLENYYETVFGVATENEI